MAITPRGKNTFLIRIYLGRDPITKKRIGINTTVHGTQADAQKREAILKGKLYSGHLTKSSRMTVNAFLDLYLDSSRHNQSQGTQHRTKNLFLYYVRPYIGTIQVSKLMTSDLQRLFNFLLDPKKDEKKIEINDSAVYGRGLAIASVHSVRRLLNSAFNFAVDEKLLVENPVTKVKLPPLNRSSAKSLTLEETIAFVSVKDNYWYGDAFVFQLHIGLRPEELMALIWDDID
jgi:integrase